MLYFSVWHVIFFQQPSLCQTLKKQLNAAINLHAKVFHYLLDRRYYPSYDLTKLLENDMKKNQ
ncbi:hypothetical protein DQX05_30105 [Paenibacillus thiaminolyticus]|uniref:Uncharacterized protein n=1 Tax=Paenibacillus thiaminolyticus TaxID=49283 RepID=A0A3A3G8B4_PANTH|nr:hypothetical protein DQX05_30105 [Paenibacillus thiaminolyticus]